MSASPCTGTQVAFRSGAQRNPPSSVCFAPNARRTRASHGGTWTSSAGPPLTT